MMQLMGTAVAALAAWAIFGESLTWFKLASAAAILIGIWICHEATRILAIKDPGSVVFDEIAAVLLIYVFVPWT